MLESEDGEVQGEDRGDGDSEGEGECCGRE